MGKETVTITMAKEIKIKAQKASKQMFGRVNVSAYFQALTDQDCLKRGIK